MVPDDWHDRIGKRNRRQDVGTHARMQLHLFEFGGGEFAGLVENVLRNGEFSHVMQQSCGFERFDLIRICEPDVASEADGARLDASDMTVSNLILSVDGHRECFYRRQVQGIEFCQMAVGVFDTSHGSAECHVDDQQERDDHADECYVDISIVDGDQSCYRGAAEVV